MKIIAVAGSNDEISREEMLRNLLSDDGLNDVTLKGSDGVIVRANRFVLSARSQVFRQMLLGQFREASAPVVEIGYEADVLRAILEYIHTDSAQVLDWEKRKRDDARGYDALQIQSLVSLASAASYFSLPCLCQAVLDAFANISREWPCLSFAVLQACRMAGPEVPKELSGQALNYVRSNAASTITADAVACLSPAVLEEILKDPEMEMTEFELFQILNHWLGGSSGTATTDYETRKATASKLSQHICLEKIDPEFLSTTVTASGLVSMEQLFEAYKQQALSTKSKDPLESSVVGSVFEEPRYRPWITSMPTGSGLPSAIKVEGAGMPEVNGVYVRDGLHEGSCQFSMQATYKGAPCELRLHKRSVTLSTGDTKWWFISILDGEKPGTDLELCFYAAKPMDNCTEIPPPNTWAPRVSTRSRVLLSVPFPAPTLLYKAPTPTGTSSNPP